MKRIALIIATICLALGATAATAQVAGHSATTNGGGGGGNWCC